MNVPCPECGTAVEAPADAQPGELLICDHCGVELEVISIGPVAVQVYEEEEK
jgi:alpha-aminoadipate/glutamate carrier protein LysW